MLYKMALARIGELCGASHVAGRPPSTCGVCLLLHGVVHVVTST